jgi:hypothetical protein
MRPLLFAPQKPPGNAVCQDCIGLLLDYVAAGNHEIEMARRLPEAHHQPHPALAAAPLDLARARRAEAQKRFFRYQRQLKCPGQCPNRSSRT